MDKFVSFPVSYSPQPSVSSRSHSGSLLVLLSLFASSLALAVSSRRSCPNALVWKPSGSLLVLLSLLVHEGRALTPWFGNHQF
ncbi:hypothetical protein PGTUg99_008810 [Puccinia graminis f. sp. tritici]|uniref:Uncharacterized protein n=1 Tax=Puccinia graminis f. sp. tritici TaxID=56615 RepID=A0A5B0Q0L7_PUCGR|nr:hypothetical protein PGTUg99_008810 [Puccinia graminis f. sp. tritici]